MQIISTMALYNYNVPVITKKKIHIVLVNHGKTFQLFSRTYKQNSRTFKNRKKIQDFSRMWQPCRLGGAISFGGHKQSFGGHGPEMPPPWRRAWQ